MQQVVRNFYMSEASFIAHTVDDSKHVKTEIIYFWKIPESELAY